MAENIHSKVKIKFGEIELECEGAEEFISKTVNEILKRTSELTSAAKDLDHGAGVKVNSSKKGIQLATSSIASKLGCKSGTDLIKAATAKLQLVDGKISVSRQEILDEMQIASSFYKTTYRSNLSAYLKTLVKSSELNEISKGNYSLNQAELSNIEGKIG